ncbi:hypothetical protein [Yersinia pestis]|uniref:hypothetical protein n=1 Tax=Yersinia pestis TaxID=632 RepID=UPI000E040853|nr:hypothetical protein [Yersinia pestis]SUQ39068.1 Uncharacterised protein [Yersinia pestis]
MYFLWKNCAKKNELAQSNHSKALSLLGWLGIMARYNFAAVFGCCSWQARWQMQIQAVGI